METKQSEVKGTKGNNMNSKSTIQCLQTSNKYEVLYDISDCQESTLCNKEGHQTEKVTKSAWAPISILKKEPVHSRSEINPEKR